MAKYNDGRSTWSLDTKDKFVKGLQHRRGKYQDPTYLGFVLLFDFHDSIDSPLLCTYDRQGTALYYLKQYSEQKYQYLKQFQQLLRKINNYMPWYWQTIEGMEAVWQMNSMQDPYQGGDDSNISIGTLESIDLPISSLMSLYRNAIYDFKYKRVILPENLRRFSVMVYIQEMRKIKIPKTHYSERPDGSYMSLDDNYKSTEIISGANSPYFLFNLKYCEFDADSGNKFLTDLNMSTREPVSQELKFKFETVEYPEAQLFLDQKILVSDRDKDITKSGNLAQAHKVDDNLYNTTIEEGSIRDKLKSRLDSIRDNVKDNLDKDKIKSGIKSRIEKLGTNIKETVTGFAANKISRLLLGNIYNISAGTIQNALQQGTVQSISNLLRN